ncbi:MAG: hypothetical protein NT059_09095 [Planctomycetota bacterium]|nr:hypothetical protein [Planctomycetota bacterium]
MPGSQTHGAREQDAHAQGTDRGQNALQMTVEIVHGTLETMRFTRGGAGTTCSCQRVTFIVGDEWQRGK